MMNHLILGCTFTVTCKRQIHRETEKVKLIKINAVIEVIYGRFHDFTLWVGKAKIGMECDISTFWIVFRIKVYREQNMVKKNENKDLGR